MKKISLPGNKTLGFLVIAAIVVSSLAFYRCGGGGNPRSSGTHSNPPVGTTSTLSWNAPTTNIDGTPLTDLAGYRIYYSTESGKFSATNSTTVGKDTTTYKLENLHLAAGTYYFTVSSYDTDGNESDFAKQISKIIN